MKILNVAVMMGALAGALSLSGCAVYPATYGPDYGYVSPPVYAPPPVVVTPVYPSYGWAWGGWNSGYRGGYRYGGYGHRHWH